MIQNTQVISNGDMTGSITSKACICQLLAMISFTVSWSGSSPVGTLTVQGSDDYQENTDGSVRVAGHWNDLPLDYSSSTVSSIPITGNSDSGIIDMYLTGIYAVRLVYTPISGTGTMNAVMCGKG